MIIDFHAHIAYHKLYPNQFLSGLFSSQISGDSDLSKIGSILKLFLKDKDCTQLLKQMDEAEIDKTVFLIVDDNECIGKSELSIEDSYDLHYKILKTHPDRFIVFAGYHPGRGTTGLELLKKGIEDYGFRGIKLYPPYGFCLSDLRLNACYEYANKFSLPIVIHTGFAIEGLQNSYAEPTFVHKIADQYQDVKFIMAHAGYKLNDPLICDLLLKRNVYADISGFQSILNQENHQCIFEMIFSEPYVDKILFGSDWPITNLMKPLSNQLAKIKEMVPKASKTSLEKVLYKNANSLIQGSF